MWGAARAWGRSRGGGTGLSFFAHARDGRDGVCYFIILDLAGVL